jgi:hypothetical protein
MKIRENVSLLDYDCDLRIVREEMDELRCMLYSEYQQSSFPIFANDQSMVERTSTFLNES